LKCQLQEGSKLAKREKKTLLLVFADLDEMKKINDTLGHEEGDRALKDTADILKRTFPGYHVVARIGGDEFVACIVEDDKSNVDVIMKRLQENLDVYNSDERSSFKLSLSTGIARCDSESPCTIAEMLSTADKLMYEQKRKKYEKKTLS
jgi:two-component system cell cycle response regulator